VKRAARALALFIALVVAGLCAFTVYCTAMPGSSRRGPLPALREDERQAATELRRHVSALSVDIGQRRVGVEATLARAERYLQGELSAISVGRLRRESIPGAGDAANLVLDLPGSQASPIVLIGAHYDSAPGGTSGANDNASGSAAALVLARRLAHEPHRLPLRFVLFANEEMPHFRTETMGSLVHARSCRQRGEQLRAMFSLETMGYFSDAPDSQRYPEPLGSL
jgi:acetylornithine deacetylase/succinyl-diaminopimelate desuccinylase-like protein